MRMRNFDGLIAYITGGSSGIGLAIAKLLASKGSDVVILSRQIDALESAVSAIKFLLHIGKTAYFVQGAGCIQA
jgi:NADP-dependent 3-hydroxy acid dehydrogenase YdfG